jgi:hypothetical protein
MDGWRGTKLAHTSRFTRGMGDTANNLPPGYLVGGLGLGGMLMLAGLALLVLRK